MRHAPAAAQGTAATISHRDDARPFRSESLGGARAGGAQSFRVGSVGPPPAGINHGTGERHIKQACAAPPRQYRQLRPRPMQRQIICDARAARGVVARAPPVTVCSMVLWSVSSPNWPAVTHLITLRAAGPEFGRGRAAKMTFQRLRCAILAGPPGARLKIPIAPSAC